jgi:hypothetical protein
MNAYLLDKEILRSPSQESDVDLVYESGNTEFSSSWSTGINVYHLCNFLEVTNILGKCSLV